MGTKTEKIRDLVREHYSKVAKGTGCEIGSGSVTGTACCSTLEKLSKKYNIGLGYTASEVESVVEGSNMNLGCGNPLATGSLQPGEHVLDLGCGGGFDSFLAAKAVGAGGGVIGVDMTADMIKKARSNLNKTEYANVSFRLGEIEHLPVADNSIDVILSNCVINLSPDKVQVWREAFRVLRPGGRCAISDIVALAPLPTEYQEQLELITGCVSGAEEVEILKQQLEAAGFEKVRVTIKPESKKFLQSWFPGNGVEQYIASANIEAYKPRRPSLLLPESSTWITEVKEKAEANMRRYGNCTQSIVSAFMDVLHIEDPSLSRISSGFLGGMTHSLTCGIHTAGVLLLDFAHGRDRLEDGMDGLYPAIIAIRKLFQRLEDNLGSHSCMELTGVDFTNPRQAAKFQKSKESKKCIGMAGTGAEIIAWILLEAEKGESCIPSQGQAASCHS